MADTLVSLLAAHAHTRSAEIALRERAGSGWRELDWAATWAAVEAIGRGLLALGVAPGEGVGLVGKNRVDWVLCQHALMAIRAVPAPIYTTLLPEQVAWIVDHAQARVVICDDAEQLGKLLEASAQGHMPQLEHIVTMDAIPSPDPRVLSLNALIAKGAAVPKADFAARVAAVHEDDVAFLIYTSGTTGTPKAVQLDHAGALACVDGILAHFPVFEHPEVSLDVVSYLPLCHIAEQLHTVLMPLRVGGRATFCPDLKSIKDYLVDARPTVFLGVPRVWEKFQAVLEARFAEASGLKARLLGWARKVELTAFDEEMASGTAPNGLARRLANRLVIGKLKGALGLERVVIASTGAAPISASTLRFFASLGICIHEAYGMSETSGVVTVNPYRAVRHGTVGKALPGVSLRIADDGEILAKGRGMTRGYLRQPEHTAELLDDDGWLHTGDLGSLEDGWLKITGRKKDILITAGGKNVAPAEMEAYLKQIPGVGQAVVVGDRQPYLAALLTVDVEAFAELSRLCGEEVGDAVAASQSPKVRAYFEAQIESLCNAKVARYQTIKRFHVLPLDFTVEGGELTPTTKVRRNVVVERYATEIAALFVA